MANNRLYLRCTGCGKMIMVAKHFGGPWDMRNSDYVSEFLIEHSCYLMCGYNDEATENLFEFINENDDL